VWLGWRGGKAVATALGMLLGLTWPVGLACFGIFLTVLTLSRIVSLSSVVAALALPLLMLGWFETQGLGLRWPYLALALLTSTLVIWRHRSNLARLLAGTEPRLGQKRAS
jgi:glycerol-3-phosphate acyltransferase PlsY